RSRLTLVDELVHVDAEIAEEPVGDVRVRQLVLDDRHRRAEVGEGLSRGARPTRAPPAPVRIRRIPRRYPGDMCCRPSTSFPAARCSRTSSSVRGASSSMVISGGVMRSSHMTLDLRSTHYSLLSMASRTTTSGSLRSSLAGGVLTLTLNRPERRNAIDPELRDALRAALDEAALDSTVVGVVLTGAGGDFCAGGDVERFDELHDARAYRHVSHRLTDLVDAVERLEKPVVAAIDGVVTGAGLALALSS